MQLNVALILVCAVLPLFWHFLEVGEAARSEDLRVDHNSQMPTSQDGAATDLSKSSESGSQSE